VIQLSSPLRVYDWIKFPKWPPSSTTHKLSVDWLNVKCSDALPFRFLLQRPGKFYRHHRVQTGSGAHPASYPTGTGGSFPRSKAAEAYHSPPSNAEVENAWSYTSTPPYVYMAWCLVKYRDNFTFNFVIICIKYSAEMVRRFTVFQPRGHFLNEAVTHSPENVCKKQDGYQKSVFKVTLHSLCGLSWGQECEVYCTGDNITVKLSLIREQNIIHRVWMFFQPSAKLYAVGVISW
jgi:hypothetical protein